jgi:hypothetical protein
MGCDAAGKTHGKERPAQTQVGLGENNEPTIRTESASRFQRAMTGMKGTRILQ